MHFEIHSSDPAKAIELYTALFGWKITQWDKNDYWLIDTGEGEPGINGAIMPRMGEPPAAGGPVTAFVLTTEVEDLDEALNTATKHDAAIALEPMAIPGVGRVAYLRDTDNNIFGVLQPEAPSPE